MGESLASAVVKSSDNDVNDFAIITGIGDKSVFNDLASWAQPPTAQDLCYIGAPSFPCHIFQQVTVGLPGNVCERECMSQIGRTSTRTVRVRENAVPNITLTPVHSFCSDSACASSRHCGAGSRWLGHARQVLQREPSGNT